MADAAPILSSHVIAELRKLDGRAKVTYPSGSVSYPTIERVYRVLQADKQQPFLTDTDEEYTTAKLVAQQQVGEDDQYVYVYRQWEVLPGIWVTSYELAEDGATVTVKRRKNAAGTQSSETVGSGVWTKTTVEAINSLVVNEVESSRAVPGVAAIAGTRLAEDGAVITTSRLFKALSAITSAESVNSGVWSKTFAEPTTELVGWQVTETRAVPGTQIVGTRVDPDGVTVTSAKTLVALGSVTTSEAVVSGTWTRQYGEPVSELVSWQISESRALPGNTLTSYKVRDANALERTSKTLVLSSVKPTGGLMALEDQVEALSAAKSEHTLIEVVGLTGGTLSSHPPVHVVEWDEEAQVKIIHTTQIVANATPVPALHSVFSGVVEGASLSGRVLTAHSAPVEGASSRLLVVLWTPNATFSTRIVLFPKLSFEFPGGFRFGGAWSTNFPTVLQPPWAGTNYGGQAPRSTRLPGRVTISYHVNPPPLPASFFVLTFGVMSRIFPQIGPNWLHNRIQVTEFINQNGVITAYPVENIPPSMAQTPFAGLRDLTPDGYSSGAVLIHSAEAKFWRGKVWRRTIAQVSESTNPTQFPPITY